MDIACVRIAKIVKRIANRAAKRIVRRIAKRATKSLNHSLIWESKHGEVESVKGWEYWEWRRKKKKVLMTSALAKRPKVGNGIHAQSIDFA